LLRELGGVSSRALRYKLLTAKYAKDSPRAQRTASDKLNLSHYRESWEDFITEKYIARSSAIAARLLGGEMMIMSAGDSTFFTLNEVATAIWQAADGCTPLSEIVAAKICSEFDVNPGQAERDAEQFVQELSQHGILLVAEQPILSSPPSPPETR
jgi:hypothetical protein